MKIGICGTMSVGKTTLVEALEKSGRFPNHTFATERSKYLNDLGIPLNTDSSLKGQIIFLAERCAELINEKIITDRTIIDVLAFTSITENISFRDYDHLESLALEVLKDYDYIFYIDPEGIPMEDNGIREVDLDFRKEIDDIICALLDRWDHCIKNSHTLKGTTEERIQQILHITGS